MKKDSDGTEHSDPLLDGEGEAFRDEDGERERESVELDNVKDGNKSSDDEDGVLK